MNDPARTSSRSLRIQWIVIAVVVVALGVFAIVGGGAKDWGVVAAVILLARLLVWVVRRRRDER
jgi:Flp pilus assembly protein TadB